jgi:3-deoxy-manno-octulosonate cytidylyltransferase (CMP-KDO synthetase)
MLAKINGQAIIQKTYLAAKQCNDITKLIVATDNEEIAAVVREVGGEVAMTDPLLNTGSDRVASVAREFSDMDIVINLQGDEPFVKHEMLSQLVTPFRHEKIVMSTLGYDLQFPEDYSDPNIVKVILDQHDFAIYFSRSPIPYLRNKELNISELPVLHHMGLYAYQREILLQFSKWQQTPLEKAELLEQLRMLENGYKIKVVKTHYRTLEINTPEELARAQSFKG